MLAASHSPIRTNRRICIALAKENRYGAVVVNMQNIERQLKAVANQRRLQILSFLKKENVAPVTEISKAINLSFRSTSKHLQKLSVVDILETQHVHLNIFYRIAKKQEEPIRSLIKNL